MKAKCSQLMLVSATQQNRVHCEQDRQKQCVCSCYNCHDGCCENSLISDFSVMINMDRLICTVTDGCNVWVPVGLSLYVYAGQLCAFACVCACVCGGRGLLCVGLNSNNYTSMTTDMIVG